MELTIKIDDHRKYQTLVAFLKSIGIAVVEKQSGLKKIKKNIICRELC